jgi:hypothetical protein
MVEYDVEERHALSHAVYVHEENKWKMRTWGCGLPLGSKQDTRNREWADRRRWNKKKECCSHFSNNGENSPFAGKKNKRRGEEAGTKEQRGFCQKLI